MDTMSTCKDLVPLLRKWADINSSSFNSEGLERMAAHLIQAFSQLDPQKIVTIPFRFGKGILLRKRIRKSFRIYFGGHYDTVFARSHPFQKSSLLNEHILIGPGAADMKGGLVILLASLAKFEKCKAANHIGWDIFLNPDEETGSAQSTPWVKRIGKRCSLAFLFEPTSKRGQLVSSRPGSANYLAAVKGKAAHAGMAPKRGKHAIYPLARWISAIERLHSPDEGILLNVGEIQGGAAPNIIPEFAMCRLNLRAENEMTMQKMDQSLREAAYQEGVQLKQITSRPPKPFDTETQFFFNLLKQSAHATGQTLSWKKSAGVCDGNSLGAMGIPTIDSLGIEGGELHTEKEWADLRSIEERILLVSHFLEKIANDMDTISQNLS